MPRWPYPPPYKHQPYHTADTYAARIKGKICEDPATGCHEWQGIVSTQGYGIITIYVDRDGTKGKQTRLLAHRVAWFVASGYWPKQGVIICHHCDNSVCVNPKHLYAGTHKTNAEDVVRRGRNRSPIRRYVTRRSTDDAVAKKIRNLYFGPEGQGSTGWRPQRGAAGKTRRSLAIKHGISLTSLTLIQSGRPLERMHLPALTYQDVMADLKMSGLYMPKKRPDKKYTKASLARMFNITKYVVAGIIANTTYKTKIDA